MWLLENQEAFGSRRLWLRPGKTYLFGRTVAEPGQLAISHNTISRKHLTITVGEVERSHAHHLPSRSSITIEDLAAKIGTVVNGQKIKGSKFILEGKEAEIVMGKCPHKFRISWNPVVFAFSFTKKELQTNPLTTLRERFDPLDIKLVTEYADSTTHVVSKKRNTAKGLQALINGKFIVNETFLGAIFEAAEPAQDGDVTASSPLEDDFDRNWPDAMQHLPPRGGEPVQHPDSIYTPDPGRHNIFEGYTFIFYDQAQFNNLLATIASGGGKALLGEVIAKETQADDFVRYVKNVAGEKGLGALEDGSDGRGVVLVRYLPSKGNLTDWYAEFITAVSLRLDHRSIEQSEFLEAILIKDASILRRRLEVESAPSSQAQLPTTEPQQESARQPESESAETEVPESTPVKDSQPAPRKGRSRHPIKKRFVGFDDEADISMNDIPPVPAPARIPESHPLPEEEEGGLFVSQESDIPPPYEREPPLGRKRPASPLREDDLMDDIAPTAALYKRQRIERGETLEAPVEEADEPIKPEQVTPKKIKKEKKEIDVLAIAAQHREQEEARARAEKEDLANLPDDVDLAEIRRLNIVEEMEVHRPAEPRTRERDIADGRWNPKWNGVKNFKKFRRYGEARGRQPARTIVPLAEVRNKEFGVGDDYWLEDEDPQRKNKTQSLIQETEPSGPLPPPPPPPPPRRLVRIGNVVISDDSDEGIEETPVEPESAPARTRNTRHTQLSTKTPSSSKNISQSQAAKRAASEPAKEQPAKRARGPRKKIGIADSDGGDDSDDNLKFRFGKRR